MKVTCPNCGETAELPAKFASKRGKCNRCGDVFVLRDNITVFLGGVRNSATRIASTSADNGYWPRARSLEEEVGAKTTLKAAATPTKPRRTRPSPGLIRTSQDAEAAARDWMLYLGFVDARLTSAGPDGGVDVQSSVGVAQVKAEARPIGRPDVQQLFGVASVEKKQALFFSLSGYTNEAVQWAANASVALFQFNRAFEVVGVNSPAIAMITRASSAPGIDLLQIGQTKIRDHFCVPQRIGRGTAKVRSYGEFTFSPSDDAAAHVVVPVELSDYRLAVVGVLLSLDGKPLRFTHHLLDPTAAGACPSCHFTYGWNGAHCTHCGY